MAATLLTVDGFDFSPYLALGEQSADFSDPERFAAQFGGNTAMNDGQPFIRDTAQNKTWTIPLLLGPLTTDALHTLVVAIGSHLFQGAQVAFKPGGATATTYFDLERGHIDPHWDFYIDTAGYLQATLTLWTRPYGHTGTTRLVASQTGTGPLQFPATGVLGDAPAAAQLDITVGSYTATARALAYAVTRYPSHIAIWRAASFMATPFSATGALLGASGALASQYWGTNQIGLVGAAGAQIVIPASLAPGMSPRNRVFALARTKHTPASYMYLQAVAVGVDASWFPYTFSQPPAVNASRTSASQWGLYDLGEITLPGPPSGVAYGTQLVVVNYAPTTGIASVPGTNTLQISALMLLPLDLSAGVAQASYATPDVMGDVYSLRSQPGQTDALVRASAYLMRLDTRGDYPRLPPTGSPVASGPAQVVALHGDPVDFRANDLSTAGIYARERFQFLR